MAEITTTLVKDLRARTGAGMMDCKKALTETRGDLEAAVDWLRTKGLAAAAKKAGRVAAEGLIGVAVAGNTGAMAEVNSETDFVARNEQFQNLAAAVARIALGAEGDVERTAKAAVPGTGRTVAEEIVHAVATIGENISLRRVAQVAVAQGVVASYVHGAVRPGLGRIGVLVGIESAGNSEVLEAVGKQLAMHIAAANPLAVTAEALDPAVVERERAIHMEQAKASGKPAQIVEKMVTGRLRKFFEEVVLLDQTFVIDGETRVSKVLEEASKRAGAPVRVSGFVRFALGEGIEKPTDDFAQEVAKMAG
jgi:elongation factor Ts